MEEGSHRLPSSHHQIRIQLSNNNNWSQIKRNSRRRNKGSTGVVPTTPKMKSRVLLIFAFIFLFVVSLESSKLLKKRLPAVEAEGKTRTKRHPDNKESSIVEGTKTHDDNAQSPVFIQSPDVSTISETGQNSKKKETPIGFLPLPPGYNKLVIPLAGNLSSSIFIMFHLSIREVLDVDTSTGIIELDTELGIIWIDWEIWKYFVEDKEAQAKASTGPEEITLDSEFLSSIWKPDIFIEEMAGIERTFLLSKLITLRFLVKNPVMPGAISFISRQTFKVRCDMEFHYYPADTQKCPLHIRSYTYPQDKLFLVWNPNQKIFLDNIEDSNYDMQVSSVEPGEELYELFTTSQAKCCTHQNFSTLTFTLELRRNLKYHLTQTCLPSILLVLITWLCFLIPPDMVEARIGISMTTLLTLTAMFTAVREQSPQVSYIMAIDIWMVFCIIMLFIALVLFTVIYWMRRRLRESEEAEALKAEAENGTIPGAEVKSSQVYGAVVQNTRKYAFILFAIMFLAFLLIYGTWLMQASEYGDWEPSPKYNAIPLEDGEDGSVNNTNRLFTLQEKKFRPNSTKKKVESEYRFGDIFKKVIFPKLQELEPEEEYEEEEEAEEEEQDDVKGTLPPEEDTTTSTARNISAVTTTTAKPGIDPAVSTTTAKPVTVTTAKPGVISTVKATTAKAGNVSKVTTTTKP